MCIHSTMLPALLCSALLMTTIPYPENMHAMQSTGTNSLYKKNHATALTY